MSILIVQLPTQPRLAAQHSEPSPAEGAPELEYVFSPDGVHVGQQGRAPAAELPAAQQRVAVLMPADTSWHRPLLPKAPGSRMRQALVGVLEEALLEDAADSQLALAPGAVPGQPGWVGVVNKPWLSGQIAQLEQAGLTLDRVVPGWEPEGPVAGHVFDSPSGLQLAWRDEQGPLCLPLDSAGRWLAAKAQAPAAGAEGAIEPQIEWSACPEGAEPAAQLAGQPVAAQSRAEFLLRAASSAWNLRQFELAPQRRGQRAAGEALQRFLHDPAWRATRLGLVLLLVLQVLGANIWAWQQRHALEARKQSMIALLQSTFPQVRAVIDAPAQMQKEIDLLRTKAGRPGDNDLEPLLFAAQAAWPPTRGPADGLHFEPGRLSLDSPDWSPQEMQAFRSSLAAMGLDAEPGPAGPTVVRGRPGAAPQPPQAQPAPQVQPAPQP